MNCYGRITGAVWSGRRTKRACRCKPTSSRPTSCCLEVWRCLELKQGRPLIEQRGEEDYLRWTNSRKEEVDEMWKDVALDTDNEILSNRRVDGREQSLHWTRISTETFGQERIPWQWKLCACCKALNRHGEAEQRHKPKKLTHYISTRRRVLMCRTR